MAHQALLHTDREHLSRQEKIWSYDGKYANPLLPDQFLCRQVGCDSAGSSPHAGNLQREQKGRVTPQIEENFCKICVQRHVVHRVFSLTATDPAIHRALRDERRSGLEIQPFPGESQSF
jgi:hypothetical protein